MDRIWILIHNTVYDSVEDPDPYQFWTRIRSIFSMDEKLVFHHIKVVEPSTGSVIFILSFNIVYSVKPIYKDKINIINRQHCYKNTI